MIEDRFAPVMGGEIALEILSDPLTSRRRWQVYRFFMTLPHPFLRPGYCGDFCRAPAPGHHIASEHSIDFMLAQFLGDQP